MTNKEMLASIGKSYRQIEKDTGIPISALSAIANGHAEPSEKLLEYIFRLTGKVYGRHGNVESSLFNSQYIADQCRADAYRNMDKSRRRAAVLGVLREGEKTAWECARALGFSERNATAPRLSELVKAELVEVVGKKTDSITGKKVSVYRRIV